MKLVEEMKNSISNITQTDIELVKLEGVHNKGQGGEFRLYSIERNKKSLISSFSLIQMPGCCGLCVSYHAYVMFSYKRKGIGQILNKFRLGLAKAYGYGAIIYTDVDDNIPQKKILKKFLWEKVFSFVNPRTRNKVNIHVKEL